MALITVEFPITGMTCNNCVRTVERKLNATPGVEGARVDLENARATVEYDDQQTDLSKLAMAVESLGYTVPGASQSS